MTDSSISSGAEMLRGIFCFKGFDIFFTKAAFCTLRSSVMLWVFPADSSSGYALPERWLWHRMCC